MKFELSTSAEDYLKTIYKLQSSDEAVTTQAVASRLKVAAPSATAMIKRLATMKLVRHERYRGVVLTEAGEKIALELIRHHRLIETYLSQALGLPWDLVHAEAERWEHVISEEVEALMAEALNHPTHDPHGSPIPSRDGVMVQEACIALSELEMGAERLVRRVSDWDPALLRHLGDLGLVPGARVVVERNEATEGVLHLLVNGEKRLLGVKPAGDVWMATG